VPHFAAKTLVKSTGTTDYRKAQEVCHLYAVELDAEFSRLRRNHGFAAQPRPLTKKASAPAQAAPVKTTAGVPVRATPVPPMEEKPGVQSARQLDNVEITRLALLYERSLLEQDRRDTMMDNLPVYLAGAEQRWRENQALLEELHAKQGYKFVPDTFCLIAEKEAALKELVEERRQALDRGVVLPCVAARIAAEVRDGTLPPGLQDTSGENYKRLVHGYTVAEGKAYAQMLQGQGATYLAPSNAAPPAAPNAAESPEAAARRESADNPRFSKVWEKYLDEAKLAPGTLRSFQVAVRRFIELTGDLPVRAITKAHVRDYKDALLQLPGRMPRKVMSLKFPAVLRWVAKEKKAGKQFTCLSAKTINEGALATLNTVFTYAKRNGYIESNPVSGMKVKAEKVRTRQPSRCPYDEADAKIIFQQSVLFNPAAALGKRNLPQRGRRHVVDEEMLRDYRWFVLVGMFTGARLEELAHLNLEDVQERQNTVCLSIHGSEDGTHRVKTAASTRLVPVHARLLELGFMERVKTLERRGATSLFPTFKLQAQGKKGRKFSDWWTRYTQAIGVRHDRNPAARTKTFHSFRHTFKNHGLNSHVEQLMLDDIQGHDEGTTSGGYAINADGMMYEQAVLFEAMKKMRFWNVTDGLDTVMRE
jgi:integrase